MFKWLEDYNEASPQTKNFIIIALLFSLVIIGSLIYCYARLDSVRSHSVEQSQAYHTQVNSKLQILC